MKTALLFVALAIATRLTLHYANVTLAGFSFGFALMGLVVLLAFISGQQFLGEEPNAPLPAIFRIGLRSTAVFALCYALFLFAFFKWINTEEFPRRIDAMVSDGIANGYAESDIRPNLESFFNPDKYAFLSFVGLLSLGAINALFFAIVQHKFLRKLRR